MKLYLNQKYAKYKVFICDKPDAKRHVYISVIYCEAPKMLVDGLLVNVTSRYYGGVAYYSCFYGYQMIGSPRVTCEVEGWSEFPECVRK